MNELFDRYAYWRVLRYFALNSLEGVYVKELARKLELSAGICSQALRELENAGFLERTVLGQAHYYRLRESYLTTELKRFVGYFHIFHSGLVETLIDHSPSIATIALYGSYVRGDFSEDSDVDILVIGPRNARSTDLVPTEELLGAEVSLEQYSPGEWLKLKKQKDPYYSEVMRNHVILYGSELP